VGGRPIVRRAALLALAAAACSSGAYHLDHGIVRSGLSPGDNARQLALVAEGDRLWSERAAPGRLAGALARWEAAVALKDDDWRTYARLARGYFFQADAVFAFRASAGRYPYDGKDGADPAAAAAFRDAHRRGYTAALRGMAARSREFEQRLRAGIGMDRALVVIGPDAAGLIYWYVANLGRWARARGLGALLRARSALLAGMLHLRRVAPTYFYAGADRLLGVYFAAAPRLVGGDLVRSRAYFQSALRAAPAYLANAVLAAEFLDRKAHDRASFEARLRAVIASRDAAPDLAPENAVERRKARALLDRSSSYFHP
jgi:hypothetical protein